MRSNDSDLPFRVGWGAVLDKFFKDLPAGYTSFYFFEFTKGYLTYRHLATTADAEAITVKLCDYTAKLKEDLLFELFGRRSVNKLEMKDLTLPTNPGKTLSQTKLASLSEKYFSIPKKYLDYYPKYVKPPKKPKGLNKPKKRKGDAKILDCAKREDVSDKNSASKKRRVGRPRNVVPIPEGIRSITSYFRSE